jgi:hypothetical protein
MNAHINLDLGIACADVAPGSAIEELHADFYRINALLGSLMPTVQAQLAEIAPRLGLFSDLAHSADRLDERLGNFSMEKARDGAWRFARRLAYVNSPLAREVARGARDAVVAALAIQLQSHEHVSALISGPTREGIAACIRILARAGEDGAGGGPPGA